MDNQQNSDHNNSNRGGRRRRRHGRTFYSNNHRGQNGVSVSNKHEVAYSDTAELHDSAPSSSNGHQHTNISHYNQAAEPTASVQQSKKSRRRNYNNRRSTQDKNQSNPTTSPVGNSATDEDPVPSETSNEGNSENQLAVTDRRNLFPNKYDCCDILCCISPDDVDLFLKSTYFWFYSKSPSASLIRKGPIPTTLKKPEGPCALYSVISVNEKFARLQAITVDLWLDGRGDLREVIMTETATNTLNGQRYVPKKNMMVGDVIFVQRMSPTPFSKGHGWDQVTETDLKERNKSEFEHRWSVDEYQLVTRRMYRNRLAVATERFFVDEGETVATALHLAVEGVKEIVEMKNPNLPSEFLEHDTVMVGTVFLPPLRSAVFSSCPPDDFSRNLLEQRYNKEGRHMQIRPTFLSPRLATEEENNCLGKRRNCLFNDLSLPKATEWLHRGFALSVPGLCAVERSKIRATSYTVILEVTEKGDDFLRFSFDCVEGNWSSGQNMVIKMASGKRCFGRVTNIGRDQKGQRRKDHLVVHGKAAGIHALTIHRSFSNKVVVRQIPVRIQGSEEEFYCGKELLDLDPEHRFHGAFISSFGGSSQSLKPSGVAWNNPRQIRHQGKVITFLPDQMNVLNAVINSDSAVLVSAGFGCGKTLLSNVMLARLAEKYPDKIHAIVVQCNFAVVNAVNCAASLDEYSNQKIVRLISPLNMGMQEERTDFDLPILMRSVFKELKIGDDISEEDMEFAQKYSKELGETNELPWDDVGVLEEPDRQQKISDYFEAVRIFFRAYNPKRIFSTTSSLLSFIQNIGSEEKWKQIVDTLIIDEASQLSAATFALLAHRLPGARPVLIGDPNQLEPYTPFMESDLLPALITGDVPEKLQKNLALSSGNILERLAKDQKWPTFYLNDVFRSHPQITRLLSDVFYQGRLQSAIQPEDRSQLMKCFSFKKEKYPVLILHTKGSQHTIGTSKINETEAVTAIKTAYLLIQKGSTPSDIAIICMYKAQAEEIASYLLNSGIFVGTVDSSQGREFRATIVCTTRSRVPKTPKNRKCFFSYSKRVLVALSRAKELLIILGVTHVLKRTSNWEDILRRVGDKDGHCDAEDFLRWNQVDRTSSEEETGSRR